MTKYLKQFETHSAYNTYINGQDKILPNVSYCVDNDEVHFNPYTDPKLVCKYNITDISSPTELRSESEPNMFKSMEIDGVLLDSLVTNYQFSTTGEHTVKYELYDETKVGNNESLFYSITTLSSVSIPNSVTSIGDSAFYNCRGLTSITIGNSVTTIGFGVFSGCVGLTSINIPNSVTTIGGNAFEYCTSLTSITIGNNVTTIGDTVFNACYSLTSIKVDSGNTVYDSRNNCNAIIETATNTLIAGCQNTMIPNGVTTIGQKAFEGCTGLASITIPNSVTSIGQFAFRYCSGLTSITSLATTAPTIGSKTFYYIKSGGTLYVPTGSTGYDVWMGTGNYYLGQYNWTKVEQ